MSDVPVDSLRQAFHENYGMDYFDPRLSAAVEAVAKYREGRSRSLREEVAVAISAAGADRYLSIKTPGGYGVWDSTLRYYVTAQNLERAIADDIAKKRNRGM